MSDFWVGVISALLGGLIGAIASAWICAVQIRTSFRLMHVQAAISHQQQAEADNTTRRREAAIAIAREIASMNVEAVKLEFAHTHRAAQVPRCRATEGVVAQMSERYVALYAVLHAYGPVLGDAIYDKVLEVGDLTTGDVGRVVEKFEGAQAHYCAMYSWAEAVDAATFRSIYDVYREANSNDADPSRL